MLCHSIFRSKTDGVKFTLFHTSTTFNTDFLVDKVRLLSFTCNSIHRTVTNAKHTTDTSLRINNIIQQIFTVSGTTFLIMHVFVVLFLEIGQRRKHRIG